MCGLMLALAVAAGLRRRAQDGAVARIDFSMVEAMLWTMARAAAGNAAQARRRGRAAMPVAATRRMAPGVAPARMPGSACSGGRAKAAMAGVSARRSRRWSRLPAGICASARVAPPASTASWPAGRRVLTLPRPRPNCAAPGCRRRRSRTRSIWCMTSICGRAGSGSRTIPSPRRASSRVCPWRASFGRASGAAPGLGADTDAVLRAVLGLDNERIAALRAAPVLSGNEPANQSRSTPTFSIREKRDGEHFP